jgi:3-isopropylmalate dehydratase small subunit
VVAASAVAGIITLPDGIPAEAVLFSSGTATGPAEGRSKEPAGRDGAGARAEKARPTAFTGRVWVIAKDNIDTDMIYHNRYLTITDVDEMGRYTFDNLEGWEDFASKAKPGDIVVTGANFGAGSSRQQAVDCFKSLGVSLIIAQSFGAIYERNAINAGFPILTADLLSAELESGQEVSVDLETGIVSLPSGESVAGEPFSAVQMEIYQRGGLLSA